MEHLETTTHQQQADSSIIAGSRNTRGLKVLRCLGYLAGSSLTSFGISYPEAGGDIMFERTNRRGIESMCGGTTVSMKSTKDFDALLRRFNHHGTGATINFNSRVESVTLQRLFNYGIYAFNVVDIPVAVAKEMMEDIKAACATINNRTSVTMTCAWAIYAGSTGDTRLSFLLHKLWAEDRKNSYAEEEDCDSDRDRVPQFWFPRGASGGGTSYKYTAHNSHTGRRDNPMNTLCHWSQGRMDRRPDAGLPGEEAGLACTVDYMIGNARNFPMLITGNIGSPSYNTPIAMSILRNNRELFEEAGAVVLSPPEAASNPNEGYHDIDSAMLVRRPIEHGEF